MRMCGESQVIKQEKAGDEGRKQTKEVIKNGAEEEVSGGTGFKGRGFKEGNKK